METNMLDEEWNARTEALALAFMRGAMSAAGIEHGHVDDAHLCAAIRESSPGGIFVVDEESARKWINICDNYD
jgi:hypothetical protein